MLHGGDTVAEAPLCNRLQGNLWSCHAEGVGLRDCRIKTFSRVLYGKNANLNSHTRQKAPSFRNLSSNEVRYKFREREKVEITVPTKSDAKHTFDGVLDDVERNILRYARSSSIHDGGVAYDAVVRCNLQITIG